jgi:hypothetical protein
VRTLMGSGEPKTFESALNFDCHAKVSQSLSGCSQHAMRRSAQSSTDADAPMCEVALLRECRAMADGDDVALEMIGPSSH